MEAIKVESRLLNVVESESGFLVDDTNTNAVEVLRTESGLHCECFIAQLSSEECEHIRAVRDYMAKVPMQEDRPTLSQADADYYLSKVAELDDTLTANNESATKQIDRIKLWLEVETDKIQRKKDYYILALDNWMHMNEYSTKRLVAGTLKVRSQQPEIRIDDE
ncbi:MAG: hypothetical protein HN633_00240, partial [Candidatus Marinimicrobia bacterium]|nr:hypothetical protein [Candidatus Neomarinimicrobiota bacterium]